MDQRSKKSRPNTIKFLEEMRGKSERSWLLQWYLNVTPKAEQKQQKIDMLDFTKN